MNMLTFLSLATLILYIIKILVYRYNWIAYPEFKTNTGEIRTGISVIIAFRNEAANLGSLLSALRRLIYPTGLYEIILVNDHSDDGSEEIVRRFCEAVPNFILLHNEADATGKKSALRNGIKSASFELIVTTDADCTMGPNWLDTIARFYGEKEPDMIIGLVDMVTGKSFIEKFQEVEYLSLIAAGAGAAAGKEPIYCNAACLAFKKSLYNSMDDPMQQIITSGDDTLFLHKSKERHSSILLLKSSSAVVVTHGATSWKEYYDQRRRWVSKSRYYRDTDILYTALLVLLMNLSLIAALVMFVAGQNIWLFPVLYFGKTFTDFVLMKSFLEFYNKELSVIRFMIYAVMYPFFAVYFTIAGLSTAYSWKGRNFGPSV